MVSIKKILYSFVFLFPILSSSLLVLEEDSFVNLIGPVTPHSVDAIIYEWNEPALQEKMETDKKTILYINSPGGSVNAGNNLIEYMKSLQARNITIECIGQNFMSMAFIIFQKCDHRMVLMNSVGMQHQMSFTLRGDFENVKNYFQLIHQMNENLIEMELEKIGLDRKEYQEKISHDWWIYGPDNVDQNTADQIISYTCSPSLFGIMQVRKETISELTFFVQTFKCPLFKTVALSNKKFKTFFDTEKYSQKKWDFGDLNN